MDSRDMWHDEQKMPLARQMPHTDSCLSSYDSESVSTGTRACVMERVSLAVSSSGSVRPSAKLMSVSIFAGNSRSSTVVM
jgi:hypothetical protein